MASGAMSPLLIENVLQNIEGQRMSLTFQKVTTLPTYFIQIVHFIYGKEQPAPLRRLRHDALDVHLPSTLKVGSRIGSGHSGHVYALDPVSANSNLPPLVVKFGALGFNKCILREAWFYDEMQTLQGEVVPWSFGLYRAVIPEGMTFVPWLESRSSHRNDVSMEGVLNYVGNFRPEFGDLVKSFADDPQHCVTALILERVGEPYLPLGGDPNTAIPKEITKDVYDAYARISELGIFHMDVKYDNILKAPAQPFPTTRLGMSSGSTSDAGRRIYKCRIIDFEISKKTSFEVDRLIDENSGYLKRLIKNLPFGVIINQQT